MGNLYGPWERTQPRATAHSGTTHAPSLLDTRPTPCYHSHQHIDNQSFGVPPEKRLAGKMIAVTRPAWLLEPDPNQWRQQHQNSRVWCNQNKVSPPQGGKGCVGHPAGQPVNLSPLWDNVIPY
jgi:hypothetical protein